MIQTRQVSGEVKEPSRIMPTAAACRDEELTGLRARADRLSLLCEMVYGQSRRLVRDIDEATKEVPAVAAKQKFEEPDLNR